MQVTYMAKPAEVERRWYVVDAADIPLGRLASCIAAILRGKHRPEYSPHMDVGDHVIVINAERVRLTGRKLETKIYYRHSGYPGGMKKTRAGDMLARRPTWVIERAVKGMLPHNTLGRKMFKKLKVYSGDSHPHAAQRPEQLDLPVGRRD